MKLRRWLIPAGAVLVLAVVVVWMAGGLRDRLPPGRQSLPAQALPAEGIAVSREQVAVYEAVPATIEARQATVVSARILARIERIAVRAGDTVKAGDLLAELERGDLAARVSRAESNVESVAARLTEAATTLRRAEELHAQGALSQADLDRARAQHDALQANLDSARQALEEARTALSWATVRAPISGRVVDRFAEPGDTARPGTPIVSLYNPDTLRVEANVRERLALTLSVGTHLDVRIESVNQTRESEIDEIVPFGNVGSRSFLVKSRLLSGVGLLPGMFAELMVPAGSENLLVIPARLVKRAGQIEVVAVREQGHIARRYVRTGRTLANDRIEILSGLAEGEIVVPFDGQRAGREVARPGEVSARTSDSDTTPAASSELDLRLKAHIGAQ